MGKKDKEGYIIGVLSGWWKIPKSPDLLGLAQKIAGFGATVGVRFIQADVETTSEFFEPRLKEEMKRVKKEMGMDVGLHGEIGELMSLESAERRLWDQAHLRLIETVKHAAEYDLKYIVIHMSNKPQLLFLEANYRVTGYFYPVVGFNGKPLADIARESKATEEMVKKNLVATENFVVADARQKFVELDIYYNRELERLINQRKAELYKTALWQATRTEAERRYLENKIEVETQHQIKERVEKEKIDNTFNIWAESPNAKYSLDTAEIAAYKVVAAYMKDKGDPLWLDICKNKEIDDAYNNLHPEFNAAVAAKYLEGHLTVKDNPANKKHIKGMSIVEWLKKHNIYLCIETPESPEGMEALLRLFNPLHIVELIKKLKSDNVRLTIDFEHMLTHKLKPDEILPKIPGEYVHIVHLSKPIPYGGTAHIPLAIGSKGQEIVYNWLYKMRKNGFKHGYLIFERGGGRSGGGKSAWEVLEHSVWTLRQLAHYLERDIAPKDLPPEFFGISAQNKETFARQMTSMRDHAWDPLEGLLQIPEEKHTFLSRAAVEKQKGELWEKRKWR